MAIFDRKLLKMLKYQRASCEGLPWHHLHRKAMAFPHEELVIRDQQLHKGEDLGYRLPARGRFVQKRGVGPSFL